MNPIVVVLTGFLLMLQSTLFPQGESGGLRIEKPDDIFRRGSWNLNLDQEAFAMPGILLRDGKNIGGSFKVNGAVEANYFFVNNIAIGAGFHYEFDYTAEDEYSLVDYKKKSLLHGFGNVAYGTHLSGIVSLVAKASVGGGSFAEGSYNSGDDDRPDVYGFFSARVSLELPLGITRHVYFTPAMGYDIRGYADAPNHRDYNTFFLGYHIDLFLGSGDARCAGKDNAVPLENRYRRGTVVLGSRTFGDARFGSMRKSVEGGTEESDEYFFEDIDLWAHGLYYVIDNLAVGAEMNYVSEGTNRSDVDYKNFESRFLFSPIVRANLASDNNLKNLFGEAGIGLGYERTVIGPPEDLRVNNHFLMTWKLGLGYHFFLADSFTLSPVFGLGGETTVYSKSDVLRSDIGGYVGVEWGVVF